MTKAKFKQKFPCGYELEIIISSISLSTDFSQLELGICPLHGVGCPKKKQTSKEHKN